MMMNGERNPNPKIIKWEEFEDDDDDDADNFYESRDRLSSAVSADLASSASEDEGYNGGRLSFASAVAAPSFRRLSSATAVDHEYDNCSGFDAVEVSEYDVWMAEPGSIQERRRRLLQGMGLFGSKDVIRYNKSFELQRRGSMKGETHVVDEEGFDGGPPQSTSTASLPPSSLAPPVELARSKSAVSRIGANSSRRLWELLDESSCLSAVRRNASAPSLLCYGGVERPHPLLSKGSCLAGLVSGFNGDQMLSPNDFCKIKNLDTGKEFIVNDLREDGTGNYLSDMETGRQLTMEEFERCVGYSPIVKELMRRENFRADAIGTSNKVEYPSINKKSIRSNAKKKGGWLKNIKDVANSVSGLIGERDRFSNSSSMDRSNWQSEWMKVRQHGKSYRELTGLYMSQEIQAHQGSIWCIRFSPDAHYLASAGEDRVIHVWEVLECEAIFSVPEEAHLGLCRSMAGHQYDHSPCTNRYPSEKKRRGKISPSSRKSSIRDYMVVPDTIFSLSKKPVCSFQGHLDDVLDLSWSKSLQLLSSSMDKTVRLWDMESKTCLKLFAHNDYVTCIQFNPVDDRYFISGSLDAKVRIWSIPDRQVVDWCDFHEMVTAACYTPDGQGALVGSHKGTCRLYDTAGCKLNQKGHIEIHSKKKKAHAKKITGFQFAPGNSSEVLITSADSQIRVFEGTDLVQKFRGFRNTSSQIAASFTPDGNYVVCASEDSQVYVWKCDDLQNVGNNGLNGNGGKSKGQVITRSHEHFHCRDVSVAIPWPGSVKYEPPCWPIHSRRDNQRSHLSRHPSTQQPATLEDAFMSTRSHLPPLPNKKTEFASIPEEDLADPSRSDFDIGGNMSFDSTMSSRFDGFSSIFASGVSSSSLSLLSSRWLSDGNATSGSATHLPTAWGLTLVTAGLGGEIRIYQNFGLPLRLQNQSLLRL